MFSPSLAAPPPHDSVRDLVCTVGRKHYVDAYACFPLLPQVNLDAVTEYYAQAAGYTCQVDGGLSPGTVRCYSCVSLSKLVFGVVSIELWPMRYSVLGMGVHRCPNYWYVPLFFSLPFFVLTVFSFFSFRPDGHDSSFHQPTNRPRRDDETRHRLLFNATLVTLKKVHFAVLSHLSS